jgi:hypothetical protein
MATAPQHHEPQPDPQVVTQLHEMGLASDDLREAARTGHDKGVRRTGNDVATGAGFDRWAEPLRYLGDIYVGQKGFKRLRPGGFEVLRSPDDTYEIAVVQGNYATGTDRMPTSRIERGKLTGQAVHGNRHQMRLDEKVVSLTGEKVPGLAGPVTWFLLHYFDERRNELRVELSVPVEFTTNSGDSERGMVTAFDPRLKLPPISLADEADIEDEDEGDDDIEISVERRR